MKNRVAYLLLASCLLALCCKTAPISVAEIQKLRGRELVELVNSNKIKSHEFLKGFSQKDSVKTDSLTEKTFVNNETGHKIVFSYKYLSNPKDDAPTGLNLMNYKSCLLTIDDFSVQLDTLLMEPVNNNGKATAYPLGVMSESIDSGGSIKKFAYNKNEYLAIQCFALGCNGGSCPTYAVVLVSILPTIKQVKVLNLGQVYPFDNFKDFELFDFNKNGSLDFLHYTSIYDREPVISVDARVAELDMPKTYAPNGEFVFSYSYDISQNDEIVSLLKSNNKLLAPKK